MHADLLTDPIKFVKAYWPSYWIYDRQVEFLESLRDNDETQVPAGNQLGKDFILALGVIWFFRSRSPCRVVTTSASQTQLKSVLWGEIHRHIQECSVDLGLRVLDLEMRQLMSNGEEEPLSYVRAITAKDVETMQGHHVARGDDGLPKTLWASDEASSVEDDYYHAADTWAHRKVLIGNPLPCTNIFYRGSTTGDILSASGEYYYRKVIRITAEDSPNVRIAKAAIAAGKKVPTKDIIPGVVNWELYQKRRKTWDKVRQMIGLDAQFYEGAEVKLYPGEWLERAHAVAANRTQRVGLRSMGVDPGEGGDPTAFCVIDRGGILHLEAAPTPDTMDIPERIESLMKEYNIPPSRVFIDRGGGGLQIAQYMRRHRNLKVKTISFGESATDPEGFKRMRTSLQKEQAAEIRYAFKNRRSEMYWMLRELLDPYNYEGFGIPVEYQELTRQLKPLPILYDEEGRIYLPPKNKRDPNSKVVTIKEMIGCSPDEADALALAVFGLFLHSAPAVAGAF